MNYEWFISTGITLALKLKGFINRYIERSKSKKQLYNSLCDEIELLDDSWKRLFTYNDSVINLLNSIGIYPNANQMHDFLLLCADSFRISSEFINNYVQFSNQVKFFSANESIMANLKNYDGMLYDYVNRVSETVREENKIVIDGRFIAFIKAYKDELMPTFTEDESKATQEEIEKIIKEFNVKILPSVVQRKPRVVFRQKRIENIFLEPIKQYIKDKEKITYDMPEQKMIELVSTTNTPIFYIINELSKIEDKIKTNPRLRYRERK